MITAMTVTISSATILCVLVELILPEGQIKKYVEGVVALLIIFAIISPVLTFLGKDVDAIIEESLTSDGNEVNYDYLDRLNEQRAVTLSAKIALALDLPADSVKIEGYSFLEARATGVVITTAEKNINKQTAVTAIKNLVTVSEEGIKINEVTV